MLRALLPHYRKWWTAEFGDIEPSIPGNIADALDKYFTLRSSSTAKNLPSDLFRDADASVKSVFRAMHRGRMWEGQSEHSMPMARNINALLTTLQDPSASQKVEPEDVDDKLRETVPPSAKIPMIIFSSPKPARTYATFGDFITGLSNSLLTFEKLEQRASGNDCMKFFAAVGLDGWPQVGMTKLFKDLSLFVHPDKLAELRLPAELRLRANQSFRILHTMTRLCQKTGEAGGATILSDERYNEWKAYVRSLVQAEYDRQKTSTPTAPPAEPPKLEPGYSYHFYNADEGRMFPMVAVEIGANNKACFGNEGEWMGEQHWIEHKASQESEKEVVFSLMILHQDELQLDQGCPQFRVNGWVIFSVCMAKNYQGRGLSGKFMSHIIAQFQKLHPDVTELYLTVVETNAPARKLYERLGFERVQVVCQLRGTPADLLMRKKLK